MDAITDLFSLTLVDGLPVTSEGREIRYRTVKLRETNVADERIALQLAERVMMINGQPRLMVSDATFRLAMTMRHIDAFVVDGMRIPHPAIDLDLVGKLSSHDLSLIEQRVFLITLAAQVRYGNISEADAQQLLSGTAPAAAPQPAGQAAAAGADAADAQPGPALLADFARHDPAGTPAGDAR